MNEKLKIRTAELDDLPVLLEFEQGIVAAERPFNPLLKDGEIHFYDLAALVASDDAGVFVGEIDGVPVASGYAVIREAKDYLKNDHYAYLGFMYVRPEFRGRGLNQQILDVLINWSKSRGISEFRLEVYANNAPAVRAYEKAGFVHHLLEMRLADGENDER